MPLTAPSAAMQEGRRLGPKPRTRKMIGMISVILAAIALIMVGYLAVGFAGYLAFPRTVSSNVLKTFPDTAIMQVPRPHPAAFHPVHGMSRCFRVGHFFSRRAGTWLTEGWCHVTRSRLIRDLSSYCVHVPARPTVQYRKGRMPSLGPTPQLQPPLGCLKSRL